MRCKSRIPHFVFATICLLLTILSGVSAQVSSGRSSGRSQPPPDGPKYTLSGRVLNSVSGEAIPNALVQVSGNRLAAVFTDREGRFQIPSIVGSKINLEARKPGFFNEQQIHEGLQRDMLDLETTKSPMVIRLIPEGLITGRVLGDNDEPLEAVAVRAMHYVIRRGRKRWEMAARGTTDDQGDFRIADLKPGTYFIETSAKFGPLGFSLRDPNQKRQAYIYTFYPGVPDIASATPIAITAGTTFQLEISVKQTPIYLVSGVIKGIQPGQNANLGISNASSEESSPFPIQLSGSQFRALVPAGLSTMFVTTQSDPEHTMYAEKLLEVKGDLPNQYIELYPVNPIPLNIRVENTKPQTNRPDFSVVRLGRSPEVVNVKLHPVDPTKRPLGSSRDGNPATIAVRNAPPGRYVVEVGTPNDAFYVQSITRGIADLSREEMTVVQGELSPIEVSIRDTAARVVGRVQDGDVGAAATIIFVPDRGPYLFKAANANQDGNFVVGGLAPGDYKVYAFDYADDLEYSNPQVLAEYSDRAVRITLDPEKTSNIILSLIRRLP